MPNPAPTQVEIDGGIVHVHPLNAGQYRRLVTYMRTKDADPVTADFMLLAWSCRDEHGQPLYKSHADAENMTHEACNKLLPICVEVNKFGQEDAKKKTSEVTPLPSASTD